jgi:Fuc2NAc and GlcNAc transferase
LATNLGFIFHNWQPARIFMGDVGSAYIGFSFAFLTMYAYSIDARLFITGVLFVWPFIFDGAYTLCRRILKKENIFQAHRSHIYQRLVIAGSSHRFVSILYGVFALGGVILALAIYAGNTFVQMFSAFLLIIFCVCLLIYVYRRETNLSVQN